MSQSAATRGDFGYDGVDGMDKLQKRYTVAMSAESEKERIRQLSFILSDHINFGNTKLDSCIAIFNLNSATDCPNGDTDDGDESDTGVCQVPFESCYARRAEVQYPGPLPYRRRQNWLWDNMSATDFAAAFKSLLSRKRNEVDTIRFSEAGDFRSNDDIRKVNRIATMLAPEGIDVYTYSASFKLDWSLATDFTVNRSYHAADYGDRDYVALPKDADLPDGMVQCPYEVSDGEIKCGECRICLQPEGPDVAITEH